MKTLEQEYLNIIQRENEIIEENRLVNSLLAATALAGSLAMFHSKVSDQTTEVSTKTEMAEPRRKTIDISGTEMDAIEQSEEEVFISKFVYAQVKGFMDNDISDTDEDIRVIMKTLATRFLTCKEAPTPYEFIKKIGGFNAIRYEFEIKDKVSYSVAQYVREFIEDPQSLTWDDPSMVWYSDNSWIPDENDPFIYEEETSSKDFKVWKVSNKKNADSKIDLNSLTDDELFLARVIYSETSTVCSPLEVKLVCKVIMNRIGNKDFGNAKNAADVVRVRNAFSCIDDKRNSNWTRFSPNMNAATQRDCVYSHFMMLDDEYTIKLPAGEYDDIVYYHDKSISCPKSWTNRYWRPVLVKETEHFKFYKIVPNTAKRRNIG